MPLTIGFSSSPGRLWPATHAPSKMGCTESDHAVVIERENFDRKASVVIDRSRTSSGSCRNPQMVLGGPATL